MSMTDAINRLLEEAVAEREVPGVAAILTDADGVLFEGQAGPRRLGHE
jgi:hypothetical protein